MRYEDLDRMFFETLRRSLVLSGVLPNQRDYATVDEFSAARAAMLANGMLVDIFGMSTEDDKQDITNNRITVYRHKEEPGTIGGSPVTYTERVGEVFQKNMMADTSRHIFYEIRLMCYGVNAERFMSKLVNYELGERRHIKTVNAQGEFTEEYAMVKYVGDVDVTSRKDLIERLYTYRVEDVFISEDRPLMENIVPLSSVDYYLYLSMDADVTKPDLKVEIRP